MAKKVTERIRIWGIVQGVGFRPFVAKTAEKYKMKGRVRNRGGLVEMILTDTEKRIAGFLDTIEKEKPEVAEIVHISREPAEKEDFEDFKILQSHDGDRETAMIPADLAICPDCLREMYEPEDPRYRHPFISCMICGPRYTITDRFPYDRDNTSMVDFPMCDFCESEYTDIGSRRYHAQTISCHDCGPQMEFELNDDHFCEKPPIEKAAALLREGRVIAFKAVGGYNLMANPFDAQAVKDLRTIKGREEKPFAVMFRDIEQIKTFCYMSPVEEKLLRSAARPIILLERRSIDELQAERPSNYDEFERSRFIGAFLPSMGAQYLLMDDFGGPVISTSANLSSMPMITDDEEMIAFMKKEPLISEMFYNKRVIKTGVDDSVTRVIDDNPQMIRRSKGYAPVPLYMEGCEGEIFAAGAELKNSFSLSKGPFAYVSQFFGDMDSAENRDNYHRALRRMRELFRIEPKAVAVDMHPGYYPTIFGKQYAEREDLPLIEVQHHHAHIASVMAEHDLEGPVIGLSCDGTGYGTDRAIWGGEVLICRKDGFIRESHLKYVDMIGGDQSVKEGWKSALSYMNAEKHGRIPDDDEFFIDLKEYMEYADMDHLGTEDETDMVFAALDNNVNTVRSSSMGRLFDGVAAMLKICRTNSYEGQCAIMLEDAAARGKKDPGVDTADDLAYKFHMDISRALYTECVKAREKHGISEVAVSGGVFQNKLLMEDLLARLRDDGFKVYYNISVSPNDGGIALGQTFVAANILAGRS